MTGARRQTSSLSFPSITGGVAARRATAVVAFGAVAGGGEESGREGQMSARTRRARAERGATRRARAQRVAAAAGSRVSRGVVAGTERGPQRGHRAPAPRRRSARTSETVGAQHAAPLHHYFLNNARYCA